MKNFRISYHKRLSKWQLSLRVNHILKHFGYFEERVNAIIARNQILAWKFGSQGLLREWGRRKKKGRKLSYDLEGWLDSQPTPLEGMNYLEEEKERKLVQREVEAVPLSPSEEEGGEGEEMEESLEEGDSIVDRLRKDGIL